MATAKELLMVVGLPVDSDAVQSLVTTDRLVAAVEPDLHEGEPQRVYLSGASAGYQLMHHSGRIVAAFLYAEPADCFAAFPELLPGGLVRGATRSDVLAQFGEPERSGEAVTIGGLGRQGAWDRFAVGNVRIHVQYSEPGEQIRLITIMVAQEAP